LGEADRDLDELVFLAADQLTAAGLDEDLGAGHAVLFRLDLRVPEEAGVDAGVAHGEREPVERGRVARKHRGDGLLGGVDDLEGVDAGLDPEPLGDGGERLDRGVARAGAETAGGAVDLLGPRPGRQDGVRHAEPEVLVAVKADLRVVAELGDERGDPVADPVHDQRAGRVDHVDALGARVGHDPGLPREDLRRLAVRHHQEADGLKADAAGYLEMLDGDVRLGAVGGDPADRGAVVGRLADVFRDAKAGQHQERDLGLLRGRHGRGDQVLVRHGAEAVVERRAAEAVAVRHLDDRHACLVKGGDDAAHVPDGELVPDRVRAVAQRGVGDADVQFCAV
jgi:hypothetical protein